MAQLSIQQDWPHMFYNSSEDCNLSYLMLYTWCARDLAVALLRLIRKRKLTGVRCVVTNRIQTPLILTSDMLYWTESWSSSEEMDIQVLVRILCLLWTYLHECWAWVRTRITLGKCCLQIVARFKASILATLFIFFPLLLYQNSWLPSGHVKVYKLRPAKLISNTKKLTATLYSEGEIGSSYSPVGKGKLQK